VRLFGRRRERRGGGKTGEAGEGRRGDARGTVVPEKRGTGRRFFGKAEFIIG